MKVFYEYDATGNDQHDRIIRVMYEKWKYQVMWELRHLEDEINEQGGSIIITSANGKSGFHTKQFTRTLTDKITEILSTIKLDNF